MGRFTNRAISSQRRSQEAVGIVLSMALQI